MTKKKMDICFAVFNCHINNALDRSSMCFISKFGTGRFVETICPHIKQGIMSIFSYTPTEETKFFVEKIREIVNEK